MKRILCIVAGLCILVSASAKLSIKEPCSDGMVLQGNGMSMIWGHASSESSITVTTSWNGKSYKAKTDSDGIWRVTVKTLEPSYKRQEIKVSGDGG